MKIVIRILVLLLFVAALAGAGTGCTAKAKKARYLARADKDFASGQYASAELDYLNVLRVEPSNARAISQLGTIYFEQGRISRAFGFLSRAVELRPDDINLQVDLAAIYLADRRMPTVREKANLILEKSPTNSEAPVLLAESVSSSKDVEQVRKRLEKLSAQIGDSAAIQLAQGTLSFKSGDMTNAEAAFRRAEALNPKSSAVHYSLANFCWAKKDLACAEAEFKTASELAPPRSARRIKYAEFKITNGDLAGAKPLLAQILKESPDYLPARIRQAEVALAEDKPAEADALIEQVLNRDAENYEGLLAKGRILMAQHDSAKAVAHLERMASRFDRAPDVHHQLAVAYVLNNEPAKAAKSIARSLALNPNNVDAVVLQAQINLTQSRIPEAIKALTELLKQNPQLAQAHLTLAAAYMAQGELDSAFEQYRTVGLTFPTNPEIPYRIGLIYKQQKKLQDARKSFERCLELGPDYFPALEELVNLDLAEEKYPEALARAEKERQRAPTLAQPLALTARIHIARAWAMLNQEWNKERAAKQPLSEASVVLGRLPAARTEVDQAEIALKKAIGIDPKFQEAYLRLAGLYANSGRAPQALESLKAAVSKDPQNLQALMEMAALSEADKDYAAARDSYEKVLALNPSVFAALNNLAYIYAEKFPNLGRAYELGRKSVDLLNSSGVAGGSAEQLKANASDTLGWILVKRGDYAAGLALLQSAAIQLAGEPDAQFHLGTAYYMLGKEQSAKSTLQHVLSLNKDFPGKDEVNRRLATLALDPAAIDSVTLTALEKRLQDEPGDAVLLDRVTAVYARNKTFDKIIAAYERVLKTNGKSVTALIKLAHLYAQEPSTRSRALELAKEAYKLAPGDPETASALGRLAFDAGDQKWALSLLEQAKQSQSPEVLYDLATAYYAQGRISDSISTMQNALDGKENLSRAAEAKRFLELVPKSSGESVSSEAEAQAISVLKSDPENLPGLMISGRSAQQRGANNNARQTYERILIKYPGFVPAQKYLAVLYADIGEDQKAWDMASKARQSLPADPEIAGAYGIAYFLKAKRTGSVEDCRNSIRLLNESIGNGNSDPKALYYLGMAHLQLSKVPKDQALERNAGKEALQKALASAKLDPRLAGEAKTVLTHLN